MRNIKKIFVTGARPGEKIESRPRTTEIGAVDTKPTAFVESDSPVGAVGATTADMSSGGETGRSEGSAAASDDMHHDAGDVIA